MNIQVDIIYGQLRVQRFQAQATRQAYRFSNPDPWEDPTSTPRSLKGVPRNLVVLSAKLGVRLVVPRTFLWE